MSHFDLTVAVAAADLLFAARVRAAGEAAGRRVVLLTARDDVLARVRAERPSLLIVDLDARWLDAPTLIRALKAAAADTVVVAFAPHVRTAALAAAREAGADRVLARSAFMRLLPELMASGS